MLIGDAMKNGFRVSFRLILIVIACAWVFAYSKMPIAVYQPVQYEILEDDMGSKIEIGVAADINEDQLRATLIRAADDHQDDAARDYLTSMYFWVHANLVSGQH